MRLPEPDADEAPLRVALADAGIEVYLAAWDDPDEPWDAPIPTLIRSTWNYAQHLPLFLDWSARLAAVAPLWNSAKVVRWNTDKRYLGELAAAGHEVVPTTYVARYERVDLAHVVDKRGWDRFVIKPSIGAGSVCTRHFRRDELDAAQAFLDELSVAAPMMIQPYVASVDGYGERSLVWIDGRFTHAIRKAPRFEGDAESVTGPFPIADDERTLAEALLAPLARDLLYARVDLARDESGRPMLMELELVEPSLFFAQGPEALDRLVAALKARLA